MNKFDKNSIVVAAGGTLMIAAGSAAMYASSMPAALEISMDAAQVIAAVAGGFISGGMAVALMGLTPLLLKYGYKFYRLAKQKLQEKYHISEQEADKLLKSSMSNDTKSSSKGIKKDLESGYKRSLENTPRRSGRNPANRTNSKLAPSHKQVVR